MDRNSIVNLINSSASELIAAAYADSSSFDKLMISVANQSALSNDEILIGLVGEAYLTGRPITQDNAVLARVRILTDNGNINIGKPFQEAGDVLNKIRGVTSQIQSVGDALIGGKGIGKRVATDIASGLVSKLSPTLGGLSKLAGPLKSSAKTSIAGAIAGIDLPTVNISGVTQGMQALSKATSMLKPFQSAVAAIAPIQSAIDIISGISNLGQPGVIKKLAVDLVDPIVDAASIQLTDMVLMAVIPGAMSINIIRGAASLVVGQIVNTTWEKVKKEIAPTPRGQAKNVKNAEKALKGLFNSSSTASEYTNGSFGSGGVLF